MSTKLKLVTEEAWKTPRSNILYEDVNTFSFACCEFSALYSTSLIGCPWLLIKFIRSYHPHFVKAFSLQRVDVSCRDDNGSLNVITWYKIHTPKLLNSGFQRLATSLQKMGTGHEIIRSGHPNKHGARISRRRVWRRRPDAGGSERSWNIGQYLPVYAV